MADSSRRPILVIVVLLLLALLALVLARCHRTPGHEVGSTPPPVAPAPFTESTAPSAADHAPAAQESAEVLTPATLAVPLQIDAGSVFSVTWTGPNNKDDYVTIVAKDAADRAYTSYRKTEEGAMLQLTAPVESGEYEVRYVAGRSKTVLGRAPIQVIHVGAILDAPAEVILGGTVSVKWTGPDNTGDYITLVLKNTPDGKYDNYTVTAKGSPLTITAPVTAGDAELRYMTGQDAKVLGRRPIKIITPEVKVSGPSDCVAGSTITVNWTGPDNPGDYITIVPSGARDGQYDNFKNTSAGSPLKLLAPIMAGEAELRYMTGQGAKVLARAPIIIIAPKITLSVKANATAGSAVTIEWTGPNNPGDYITVVPIAARDGQYGNYTNTSNGSPLKVGAPKEPGDAEVRYMSGQGGKVLGRQSIRIVGE